MDLPRKPSTLVPDGIVTANVEDSHLVIRYGFPRGQGETRISRLGRTADGNTVDRIVFPARHGHITFDAMRWLHEVGITWSALDDGQPTAYASNRSADALLIRAQARLQDSPTGIVITRHLLALKIERQCDVLRNLAPDQVGCLETCLVELDRVNHLEGLRGIEANAAKAYWTAWQGVTMRFAKGDAVPDHWRVYESRLSPISMSAPRNAACPVNALLNYAYGVLETETIAGCHKLGLDPLLGILHTDIKYRYSMAHDMMEPGRAWVDAGILDLVHSREFSKREFVETSKGVVRLRPALTKHMAALVRDIIPDLHSTWEYVLNHIVDDMARGDKRARTPLTKRNAKARYAK